MFYGVGIIKFQVAVGSILLLVPTFQYLNHNLLLNRSFHQIQLCFDNCDIILFITMFYFQKVVLGLLAEKMLNELSNSKGYLIDGYPRELTQGQEFEKNVRSRENNLS